VAEPTRRPPVPSAAERARTIAARHGRAVVLLRSGGDTPERIEPHLHHVRPDGSVALLFGEDHPLVAAVLSAPGGEFAAMAEVADRAAVALREPVRALLWITGWLQLLDDADGRAEALAVAEERPDSRLLDVGHGMRMLRLRPASLVIADGEGTDSLLPGDFASAGPDPFADYEDHWLRHLELAHTDVVGMLTRLIPEQLRGGHVRPLGLDRLGLRLRVETVAGDHDVRLAFPEPVSTPAELAVQLRRLVGCPFLAAQGKSG
jgi:Protein of unknown function (DUF2470)